jgi:hypothetical protein
MEWATIKMRGWWNASCKDVVIDVATNREIFKSLQSHPKCGGDFFRQRRLGCTMVSKIAEEPRLNSLKW